ncbi:histidine kinase [Conexibacter stalactiti]|uniref:histidine kinase n=1 Tax=Conexibacter stalactiti TaxID=1940611 RepID=A0ABU4HZE5_9ACTN|nr:histidine kinase [Conexibacter stalactiti]MDW5597439.1 histidine kinase [Conexibacter stalactiti]MEC5038081.1 histidine kinase [Conexibacter stalactiti]
MSPRLRHLLTEATIAAATALGLLIVVFDHADELPAWSTWTAALVAGGQSALLWRRHAHREQTAALVLLGALALQLLCPPVVMPFAAYVAVGSLAAHLPPQRSWWGLAALLGLAVATLVRTPLADDATGLAGVDQVLFLVACAVGIHVYGDLRRNRAARQREQERRAVAQEQARIARELHDVVAHSVAVIVVQASAAGEIFDDRPERARESLQAIEATARETLTELRRLVGGIRTDVPDAPSPLHPQPSLAHVEELAARVRATGLEVTVTREGAAAGPVPAGVDLSAYRIVQEALTNTLRHARARRAEVALRYGPDALELDVRDDGGGHPAAAGGDGHGLGTSGMRERAALLGGTLEAGPGPHGGYRVHARLPLGAAS